MTFLVGKHGKNPFVRFNLKCPRDLWAELKATFSKDKDINEHLVEMFHERVDQFKKNMKEV